MPNPPRRVLFVGLQPEKAASYEQAMADQGFEIEVQTDPAAAEKRLTDERFDAVVAAFPLSPGDIGRIMTELRSRSGQHRSGTGLLLLAAPDRLRGAAGLVGRGVHKALSIDEDPAVLGIVLLQMVEFSQPMAERLPLRVEVSAVLAGKDVAWSTENLSGSGMLICTKAPPELGTHFDFTLALPAGKVEGEAKVVRHTCMGRECADGFGARFSWFMDDGQAQLLAYLRSARK